MPQHQESFIPAQGSAQETVSEGKLPDAADPHTPIPEPEDPANKKKLRGGGF